MTRLRAVAAGVLPGFAGLRVIGYWLRLTRLRGYGSRVRMVAITVSRVELTSIDRMI